MSAHDYLRLRNYLDRPGETVLPPYPDEFVTIVAHWDEPPEPDSQSVLVRGRLGMRETKTCTHAFNKGEDRDTMSMVAESAASLMALDSRNAPAIDRLAMKDLTATMLVDRGLRPARPVGFFEPRLSLADPAISVALPPWRCKACRGMGFERWAVPVESDDEPPFTFPPGPVDWDVEERPCHTCRGSGRVARHEWMKPQPFAQGELCQCNTLVTSGAGAQWLERHPHCPWCVAKSDTERVGLIAHGLGLWGWRDGDSEDGPGWDYPFGVLPFSEDPEIDDDGIWAEIAVAEIGRLYNRQRLDVAWAAAVYADVVQVVTERVALARESVERADMGPWNHAGAVADPISPATV